MRTKLGKETRKNFTQISYPWFPGSYPQQQEEGGDEIRLQLQARFRYPQIHSLNSNNNLFIF